MAYESRIGRFHIRGRIGRGSVGDVSLAYDPESGQELALKVIHVGIEPERLEAEKRGAEIQQQLSRVVPQIAKVYEIGQDGDQFFIAMEYVRGFDLSDLLRAGPIFPEPRAVSFAVQLCAILEACSRVSLSGQGNRDRVVHGDIKPQNIRIEDDDRVRLLDFGVAKSVSITRQYTGNVFGSLPYLSPERLNDTRVSVQSDLWSVGIVLYQMVTGELPYPIDSDEVLRAHIRRGGLPESPHPRLRVPLRQILSRCLEVEPSRRYREAAELRAVLEGLEPPAADSESRFETRPTVFGKVREQRPFSGPARKPRRPFWSRFFRNSRSELRQIQERLHQLRIPTRARCFQSIVDELDRDLEKSASRLQIGRDLLERLDDRVRQLSDANEPLTTAIRQAELIEKEVRHLDPGIQGLTDAPTRSWFQNLSRGWTEELQNVGTNVFLRSGLQIERDRVKSIRDEILLYAEILSKLDEAQKILSVLGSTVQTAALSAGLSSLQEQLRKQGPLNDWLQRIEALIQPLREAKNQAKDPIKELKRLFHLIKELRSWSESVGELKTEVKEFEQRHDSLISAPRMSDVEALDQECVELRDRLIRRAQELRAAKLAELEKRVELLASVCDPQPDLEERLRSLKRKRSEGPESLPEWMSQLEQVEEIFRSALRNQESGLEQGLAQAVARLRTRLEALQGQPLSSAAQQEALALGDEIRELERPAAAGEILRRLSRCNDIGTRIEQLRHQITDDLQELFRQQQHLKEINEDLQAQARHAGIQITDLSQRIDELDEGAKELERARQLAELLHADLNGLLRRFEEECRKVLGEHRAEVQAIVVAFRQIGHPLPAASLPDLATGAAPKEAAEAVVAGLELARNAREMAHQVFRDQKARLQEARSVLQLDPKEELGPDERETAAKLLAEIEEDLAKAEADWIGRLERSARLIEDCEPLLRRLHQDERTARERRALLIERLQRQSAQDLRRLCPEAIIDRVAGLVYGIPDKPWQWEAVQTQLAEAERLLTLVEAQTARRAAAELNQAVRDLRAGAQRAEIEPLLAELAQYQEVLPPLRLRRRILEVHERQQAQGGRA